MALAAVPDEPEDANVRPKLDPSRNVTPLTWLRLLRDDPRFGHRQLGILAALAATVSGKTGQGFASLAQLAAYTNSSVSTTQRALGVAEGNGYLFEVERGHRRGDGTGVASTYQLQRPPRSLNRSGVTG